MRSEEWKLTCQHSLHFFFFWLGDWTPSLHTCCYYFFKWWDKVLWRCPGWARTCDCSASASQCSGITAMHSTLGFCILHTYVGVEEALKVMALKWSRWTTFGGSLVFPFWNPSFGTWDRLTLHESLDSHRTADYSSPAGRLCLLRFVL